MINALNVSHAEMLSSFPMLSNESFTFNYTEKRGVELDFTRSKPERILENMY